MIHWGLYIYAGIFVSGDLNAHNYRLFILHRDWGGGLISPVGPVCLDGMCNSRLSYFDDLFLVPNKYFPAGEYFSVQPLAVGNYMLHAQPNYLLKMTRSTIVSNPLPVHPDWRIVDSRFGSDMIAPGYYYLFPPNNFWNGRFILEWAYMK